MSISKTTLRIDTDFYKEVKKKVIDKDLVFNTLVNDLLEKWYKENK